MLCGKSTGSYKDLYDRECHPGRGMGGRDGKALPDKGLLDSDLKGELDVSRGGRVWRMFEGEGMVCAEALRREAVHLLALLLPSKHGKAVGLNSAYLARMTLWSSIKCYLLL